MGGKESDLGGFAKKDGAACFLFQRHAGWARRGSAAPGLDARGVFVPAMRARYLIAGRFERAVEEKPRRRALPKTSDLTERASRDVESPGVPSRSRLNVDARAGAKRGKRTSGSAFAGAAAAAELLRVATMLGPLLARRSRARDSLLTSSK